jgi:RNA polymerase sigma-70 factor (ECF subfamily)
MTTAPVAVPGPCLPAPNPDAALIARLRAGDGDAYESLFRTYAGGLMAVARRFLGDTDDAAEAVQEAFVSAFRGMARFEGAARLGTWLHRIAVNTCLMKVRSRKRRRCVPLGDLEPAARPDAPEPAHDVRERLLTGIARLPEAYRAVIRLRDLEGLDTAATAARLGTNEGVVKTRLHRARHALRELLAPELESLMY